MQASFRLAVAAGVSPAAMELVKDPEPLRLGDERGRETLGDKGWTVLVYADEMTRKVEVADATFKALRALFDEREVVEITATVSELRGMRGEKGKETVRSKAVANEDGTGGVL